MSDIFFTADLHFGHKGIANFGTRPVKSAKENIEWITDNWNSIVTKRDVVYVLGDVCFKLDHLPFLKNLRGQKILIKGNHDRLSNKAYSEYFVNIHGILKKWGFWLTHCPIHPQELRGHKNIHGHVHGATIPDDNYINVCVDVTDGKPISLKTILEG